LDTPIASIPGSILSISMFTLMNCPKAGCEQAGDSISVQITDGGNGEYNEVYNVNGRTRDDRWVKENFNYIAVQDKMRV
jgi:hypothetical protein